MSAAGAMRALTRSCPTCGAGPGQPCRLGAPYHTGKVHAARYLPDHLRQPMTPQAEYPRAPLAGRVPVASPRGGTHMGPGGGDIPPAAARSILNPQAWQIIKAQHPELAGAMLCRLELGERAGLALSGGES